ncbi:hypothetical protein [Arthrobacter sp. TWP1-1]|uniref:hypothetical protein n=1 Tax=Arthrobacter sp. TWP1-1 TaxID=2804568 RepID=UPI003CEA0F48
MHKEPDNSTEMPQPKKPDVVAGTVPLGELRRPFGVYVVACVVGVEALALGIAAVWAIISAISAPMFSAASGIFLVVLIAAMAAGLAAVAINVFKGMRWTRSAAFVWQLLMAALAVPALLEGNVLLGLVMLLPAVAAAYYLFTPTVVAFSQRTGGDDDASGTAVL